MKGQEHKENFPNVSAIVTFIKNKRRAEIGDRLRKRPQHQNKACSNQKKHEEDEKEQEEQAVEEEETVVKAKVGADEGKE
ncbi:hypothetical protein GQ600_1158 [Phytophthora cactorum]|nr:hypothetical protein GQ600_1158 [Phytophthora cactorum]